MITALVLLVLVVSLMPAALVASAAHILPAFKTAISLCVVSSQAANASLHVVAMMMATTEIALVLGVACADIATLEVLLLLVSIVIIYHVVKVALVEATSLRRRLTAATAVASSALHTTLIICGISVFTTSSSGLKWINSP